MMHSRFKRAMAPIAAVLILCLTAGAQVAQVEKVDLEMMKKIRAEGMDSTLSIYAAPAKQESKCSQTWAGK
jgi:hypothetical protein